MAEGGCLVRSNSDSIMDNLQIRLLQRNDIQEIAAAFAALGWNKPTSQYDRYYREQAAVERVVLVARLDKIFAGYVTIVWESPYPFFWKEDIPEIVDFNVLPQFRRKGIGTELLDEAEERISQRSPIAGIGVGMMADYGAAQILYVKRGYIPDGRGLIKEGRPLSYGDQVSINDELVLYFTKQLSTPPQTPTKER